MAYLNFTKNTIFNRPDVNILCNRIFDVLVNEFTSPTLLAAFCITGTVSKIIQGAALSDIEVIPFITNSSPIFNFCADELPKAIGATAVKFKDRIEFDYKGVFFEIWFTDTIGTINTVSDVPVQDVADIPLTIK